MYFDIEVKEKKEDLYNHDKEYRALKGMLAEGKKLIVVKGVRRVGKTSLMKVIYCSLEKPKVWIDGRTTEKNGHALMEWAVGEIWRQVDIKSTALSVLSSISLGPVSLKKDGREQILERMAEELNNHLKKKKLNARVFIDEAQLINGLAGPLSYFYDHFSNFQFVVSGSEVGVLSRFTGSDPDSPLFGRLREEIEVERLSPESAKEYLKLGSLQSGKEASKYDIDDAIERLDGLIGWLTYYGYRRMEMSHEEALKNVLDDAKIIVKAEVEAFLKKRKGKGKRYLGIIKALSRGPLTWTDIKRSLLLEENAKISSGRLNDYLEALISHSFISKSGDEYILSDPILKIAFR